jgi:exo-beta-1,3-glucanase (GH17 family)/cellulose synthase/poly-beta-1,6-N-acetylglucosamine synthase-like glycosyltransferase
MTARLPAVVALLLALLLAGHWAWIGRPHEIPDARGQIHGVAYTPYQPGQQPGRGEGPSPEQVAADVRLFHASGIRALRTYSAVGPHAEAVRAARRLGMPVSVGVWLSGDRVRNRAEIEAAVALARENPNVVRILAGNEAILRGNLTVTEVRAVMRELRARTGLPVSTAEPWGIWLQNPELAIDADHVVIHVLPFWEHVSNRAAASKVLDVVRQVRARFSPLPVVVGETGWPSAGRSNRAGVPTLSTQAEVVRTVLPALADAGVEAFVMEAIDQPWKFRIEGSVGPHWGIWDADRQAKFAFHGPVSDLPAWPWFALASVLAMGAVALLVRRTGLAWGGQILLLGGGAAAVLLAGHVAQELGARYWHHGGEEIWILSILALLGLAAVAWADLREAAQAAGRDLRRPVPTAPDAPLPPVSIHLPCHAEPPDVVRETLDSLARLDYPDFEVLVLDNNTRDPALWRPVEAHCAALNASLGRPVFRFFHDEGVKGFKAGALNLGLARTRPDAEVVAVVDADYVVAPGWLRAAVPVMMADPRIGLVQSPQDHRDGEATDPAFKRGIRWEYEAFFKIGMRLRNEDDAIVQHGTMCLVRRAALEAVGGWATDCICEDTELGLRLSAAGWTAHYLPRSQGRGLSPDSFAAYATQRYRWAYGGIRILLKHWRLLLPSSPLSGAQRRAWIAGWIPWLGEGAGLVAAWAALGWTALVMSFPHLFLVPPPVLSVPVALFLLWKVGSAYVLQRTKVGSAPRDAFLAVLAGLALAPFVGRAVLHALVTPGLPFARTPKAAPGAPLLTALRTVRTEASLAVALTGVGSACALWMGAYDAAAWPWGAACIALAAPHAAAVAVAVLAARPRTAPAPVPAVLPDGQPVMPTLAPAAPAR